MGEPGHGYVRQVMNVASAAIMQAESNLDRLDSAAELRLIGKALKRAGRAGEASLLGESLR